MAATQASDFKIYNDMYWGGVTEVLQQNVAGFNANSLNSLILVPRAIKGDFEKESFIQQMTALVGRRDTTSLAAQTDTALTQDELVGIKLNRKIKPVASTLDAWRKIVGTNSMEDFSYSLGQSMGSNIAADYINVALSAVANALGNEAGLALDITAEATKTPTHDALIRTMALLGDQAQRLQIWVMHSSAYFKLMQQSVADKIFEVAGATIYQGTIQTFNRPVLVIDSPSLVVADAGGAGIDGYYTLGLTQNALEVAQSEEQYITSAEVTGQEQLIYRVQGEYAFNLKMKGFAWDLTNGGVNPTDAAVATATNWDRVAADIKSCAGTALLTL